MKITLEIPDYDGTGVDVIWEENAEMNLGLDDNGLIIKANPAGLVSLAKEMLYLASHDFPDGTHIHYDDFFTGQDLGCELIIERDAVLKQSGGLL